MLGLGACGALISNNLQGRMFRVLVFGRLVFLYGIRVCLRLSRVGPFGEFEGP